MTNGLVRGGWVVVTGRGGDLEVIEDGAVYHEDGAIQQVGRFDELGARHPGVATLGSREHIVLPGFVNAHHHAFVPSIYQQCSRDDALEAWLLDFFWRPILDPYRTTLHSALTLLESGITTVLHCHYSKGSEGQYEDDTARAIAGYRDAGIRVSFGPEITDRPSWVYERHGEFVQSLPEHLQRAVRSFSAGDEKRVTPAAYLRLFEKWARQSPSERVRLILRPVVPHYCSDTLLRDMKDLARSLGAGIHINIYETMFQRMFAQRLYGGSVIRHLDRLGFLDRRVSCAHGVWLDDEDLATLAATGAAVVSNPSSNLRLSSGIAPVVPMMRRGIPVAVGIDALGINDDDDMLQEMRLAAMLHRLPGRSAGRLSTEEVFLMATRHGARATFWEDEIGAIEPGRRADLVLLRAPDLFHPFRAPRVSLLEDLLQRGRRSHVDSVLVDGEEVVRHGRALRASREDLTRELADEYRRGVNVNAARVADRRQICEELKKHLDQYYQAWGEPAGQPYYRYNRRG